MKPERIAYSWLCALALAWPASADLFVKSTKTVPVGPNPSAIVAADLNGDNRIDIVTADRGTLADWRTVERPANDELSLLIAQEDLSYVRQPLKVDFGPYALAVANVDTEKAPDILAACFHATRNQDLVLLRNIGQNLFERKDLRVPDQAVTYKRKTDSDNNPLYPTPGLTSVAVRDFNGDGYRDAVATGWCSDTLVFFPGDAEDFLGDPEMMDAPGGPRDVQAADFNNDGKLDLAVTLYSAGEIGIWEGDGKGAFIQAARFASRGRLPHKLRVQDINLDDKPDLIVSQCYTEDSILIFYGDGGFGFSISQEILLGESREKLEQEIRDIVVEDMDANGRPDIVAACYGSGQVIVLQNVSSETTAPQRFRHETYTFDKAKPRALCVADFNADGAKDLGVALWEPNTVAQLLGTPKEKEKAEEPAPKKSKDKDKPASKSDSKAKKDSPSPSTKKKQ